MLLHLASLLASLLRSDTTVLGRRVPRTNTTAHEYDLALRSGAASRVLGVAPS